MCGLAAIYSYSGQTVDPADLERMTHTLNHRGPDDFGFSFSGPSGNHHWKEERPEPFAEPGVGMGHRRLSILDLSEAGRQPYTSSDGRYTMVYNGEVYNYIELRDELCKLGHEFCTATDTEVVLSAYAQWGSGCFNRLNGMWGLVIWDNVHRTLVACRDRFGIKPLYFHTIDGAVLFGSEVKALLQHPRATRKPDPASVVAYLARRAAPTGGASFFSGVSQVKPGCWVCFDANGQITGDRYWSLPEQRCPASFSFEDAAEKMRELLTDSVRLRLRSDVKAGTMLSGGLDSTTVIALVASLMDAETSARAVTGESLHSFTASFPGLAIDESTKVDELCSQLPLTKNNVLPLEATDLIELMKGSTYSMEMPWFNSVPLVHSLLMRRAQKEQVTVVLNGHGADEVYAGYPHDYVPTAAADDIIGLNWGRALHEIRGMRKEHGFPAGMALRSVLERLIRLMIKALGRSESWTSEPLVLPALLKTYPSPPLELGKDNSGLDRLLRTHFFERMLPAWLHFEDRISMAYSVEARLPFMDYRLIEFGFSLPDKFKIRDGHTKAVLRKAMADTLPRSISQDSRKTPFSGPDAKWLSGPLRPLVEELLNAERPLLGEFVDLAGLKRLVADFRDGKPVSHRIWVMLSTEIWLQTYFGDQVEANILA